MVFPFFCMFCIKKGVECFNTFCCKYLVSISIKWFLVYYLSFLFTAIKLSHLKRQYLYKTMMAFFVIALQKLQELNVIKRKPNNFTLQKHGKIKKVSKAQ